MNTCKALNLYHAVDRPLVFTSHVINTLRALPYEERMAVASAIAAEMLLGADAPNDLRPEESMIYSVLRFYVNQASARYLRSIS